MITIPADFAAGIRSREGADGEAWLAGLPGVIADLCELWSLEIDGRPSHGHLAMVVPVQRHGQPCVLKVSWQDADTRHEAVALNIWQGRGIVQVLESSPAHGAMLLERLDPDRTLFGLPLDASMAIAGAIMRRLAIPGEPSLPTAAGHASEIVHTMPDRWERLGRPIPAHLIAHAVETAATLSQATATTMVNWDLHYGNVLFSPGRQQWVVVDPKPALGVPESGIAQLLWTRISDFAGPTELNRHVDTLIAAAQLDNDLARKWTRVRVVDFWLWELSVGLADDPGGCAIILDWLEHE